MRALGLDLSLVSTGYALLEPGDSKRKVGRITPGTLRGVQRLDRIVREVGKLLAERPSIVVLENYAFGRANQAHQLGELGGVVRYLLYSKRFVWTVVPPAVLKGYACGKGNASKDDVFGDAIRRLDYKGSSNDEADALWLATMACDAYGWSPVKMPAANREWLQKVSWPDLVTST